MYVDADECEGPCPSSEEWQSECVYRGTTFTGEGGGGAGPRISDWPSGPPRSYHPVLTSTSGTLYTRGVGVGKDLSSKAEDESDPPLLP